MHRTAVTLCCLFPLLLPAGLLAADKTATVTEGTNFALALGPDGSMVIDVQGALWKLPAGPGAALALTDGMGDDRLPRFSPDGAQLIFQSFRRGDFNIWRLPLKGGDPQPLTSGPADDREPAWFPDGQRIAFTSDRSGNLDIWQLDLATGALTPLTSDPADDYWPAVSADGKRLAFVSDRDGPAELYVQALEDKAPATKLLAGPKSGPAAAPAWSPDGRTLAYIRAAERIGFPSMARHELVLADLTSGTSRPVSAPDEDVFPFPPAFSADGTLSYTADGGIRRRAADGTTGSRAFTLKLPVRTPGYRQKRYRPAADAQPVQGITESVTAPDGSVVFTALGDLWWRSPSGALRQLTDDTFVERDPAFAPDGRSLVFISDRGGSMQVWQRDLDTGTDRELTRMPRGVRYPTFAPDGRTLAFQQAGPRGNQDFSLHRLDLATGAVSPIAAPPLWPGRMGFSADGRRLIVAVLTSASTRFRAGRNMLRAIDLESGEAVGVDLPEGLTPDAGPVLSPDGRTAALVIDGELWLLPLRPDGTAERPPQLRASGLADYPSFGADGRSLTYLATGGLRRLDNPLGNPRVLPLKLTFTAATGSGDVLIRAGRVFDGIGPEYRRQVDVLISGDRIVDVGPDLTAPEGALVIDAREATVLPGLIDNHAHHQAHDGEWVGRAWLAFGVTSVVETGGLPYESRELLESWVSNRRPGPRLFQAGPQLDGTQRFFPFSSHVVSERRLDLEMRRATALDYSLVKTYTRLPVTQEALAIRAAHRLGLPVASHEIYPALALGGDRVEHLRGTSRLGWSSKQSDALRMYDDAVQLVGTAGATIVPTMVVGGAFLGFLLDNPDIDALPQYAAFYSPADRRALRALAGLASRQQQLLDTGLANSRRAVRDLAAAGARIVAGTDAPIFPYGLSLLVELRALRAAGLPPAAVLRAATADAAAAIGAGDRLGRIAPGMLADLLIVAGDPLADPMELTTLTTVIQRGIRVPVSGLLQGPRGPARATLPARSEPPATSP